MIYIAHINPNTNEIQNVNTHLINTSIICTDILSTMNLSATGKLLGILHDMGKYGDAFQNYIRGDENEAIHSFAAVRYLIIEKYNKESDDMKKLAIECIATAIANHHGFFDNIDINTGEFGLQHRCDTDEKNSIQAADRFFVDCISLQEFNTLYTSAINECSHCLRNIVETKSKDTRCYISFFTRYLTSALIEADREDTIRFTYKNYDNKVTPNWERYENNLNSTLENFKKHPKGDNKINEAKMEISETCYVQGRSLPIGIYKLNIPAGAGKTYSSLRFALVHRSQNDLRGIIYVAPYNSILEQNSDNIKSVIDDRNLLEHFSNETNDEPSWENYYKITDWWGKDTWDVAAITTTLAQMFLTLFGGKTSSVRRFCSLYKKIIIFDEIQQIPTNQVSLFNLMVNFLSKILNCTIILCSATLPEFDKFNHSMFVGDEIVKKDYSPIFKRVKIQYDKTQYSVEDLTQKVQDLVQSYNSVLVVCNTKSEASDIYNNINNSNIEKYFIAASMCVEHRANRLNELKNCINNHKKVICVATQCIEAGVDISFEVGIRVKAGLDNIIQTAGRINRYGEHKLDDSILYVMELFNEDVTKLKKLPDIQKGKSSLNKCLICDKDMLDSLTVQKQYYRFFYSLGADEHPSDTLYYMENVDKTYYELISKVKIKENPNNFLLSSAIKTATENYDVYNSDTFTIYVPYGAGENLCLELYSSDCINDKATRRKVLEKLQRYKISVYAGIFQKYLDNHLLTFPYDDTSVVVLEKSAYSDVVGLSVPSDINGSIILI